MNERTITRMNDSAKTNFIAGGMKDLLRRKGWNGTIMTIGDDPALLRQAKMHMIAMLHKAQMPSDTDVPEYPWVRDILHVAGVCSNIFRIDAALIESLLHSDYNKYVLEHLPFKEMFLDIDLVVDDVKICGIGVIETEFDVKPKTQNNVFHNIVFLFRTNDSWCLHYDFLPDYGKPTDWFDNIERGLISAKTVQKIQMFINAFLMFITMKDVQIIYREVAPIRIIRNAQKRKNPVCSHYYIKLTGKTRRYVDLFYDSVQKIKRNDVDYKAQIVRGFLRHLIHPKYRKNITWVMPHIRGDGPLSIHEYYVTEKSVFYYHEERMTELITKLFPNQAILRHTRGILNGLEIDCYIPALKLGFEYNGEQHYMYVDKYHRSMKDFKDQVRRDRAKLRFAKDAGIKLIVIRYDEELSELTILQKLKGGELK